MAKRCRKSGSKAGGGAGGPQKKGAPVQQDYLTVFLVSCMIMYVCMHSVYNICYVWQFRDAELSSFCKAMRGCCSWQLKLFSWKRHTSWLDQAAVGFQAVKLKLWSDWHLIGP